MKEKITDRVHSLEAALEINPQSEEVKQRLGYTGNDPMLIHQTADLELKIMIGAVNKVYKEETGDERKPNYFPWFWKDKPGVGFSFRADDGGHVFSTVASRLCLATPALVEECATHPEFLKRYEIVHMK